MTTTVPQTTCRPCLARPTPDRRWRRILAWAVPLALVALLVVSVKATLLLAAATLVLLTAVVVHEAGHLVAARRAGAAVTEFAVGFGPVLAVRHARGLDWTWRAIPLGGFCHVVGQGTDRLCPEHAAVFPGVPMERTTFRQQLAVGMSGIGFNLIGAWFLLLPVVARLVQVAGQGQLSVGASVTIALVATTVAVAVTPFLAYLAIVAYVAAIPSQGWTDQMGSVVSLPSSLGENVQSGAGADLPVVLVLLLVAAGVHLSLAALNALPLFPLDGFHTAALVVRRVRNGRPVPRRAATVTAGLSAIPLGVFVVGLLVKDVAALLTGR